MLRSRFSSCPQPGGWDEASLPLQFASHSMSRALPAESQFRRETEAPGAFWMMAQNLICYIVEFAENKIFGQFLHVQISV